jgi:hypothetical protein
VWSGKVVEVVRSGGVDLDTIPWCSDTFPLYVLGKGPPPTSYASFYEMEATKLWLQIAHQIAHQIVLEICLVVVVKRERVYVVLVESVVISTESTNKSLIPESLLFEYPSPR